MSSAQNDFLHLLRCALWDLKPNLERIEDWNGVLRLAQRHTTLGLAGHAALQTQAVAQLLPESHQRLQHEVAKMAADSKQNNLLVCRLLTALQAEQVHTVLLKGVGLADFYPQPELRHCGDIDLLVKPEQFEKAIGILNKMATTDAVQKAFTSDKHYHIVIDGRHVELHRHCMTLRNERRQRAFLVYETQGCNTNLDDFQMNGIVVHRPEATFNAVYVLLHLWEHFKDRGIGLRQVCDWTMLIHARHERIDTQQLTLMLNALQLYDVWRLVGSLAVRHLGLPQTEMPFYDSHFDRKANRMLRIILKEGNFGKARPLRQIHQRKKGVLRRLTTLVDVQVRAWRIFILLPKAGWQNWKEKMKGGISK